ncbi:MAG: iron-sulfur cluster assembly scaffold protein [Coriobacteriales bacterium]|jgi:NifU-like protein involved in Fe-S cluster formation|nr:iron-sulfur cluster assembly scaffold protein [Coriobacteriales bacterium]
MPEHTATGDNPLCGDTVTVTVVTDAPGAEAGIGTAVAGGVANVVAVCADGKGAEAGISTAVAGGGAVMAALGADGKGASAKGGCVTAPVTGARIVDASWSGYGCELCLGTADRLMEEVKGRMVAEVLELTGEEMLGWYGEQRIGRMRQDCVLLPLKVLRKALEG